MNYFHAFWSLLILLLSACNTDVPQSLEKNSVQGRRIIQAEVVALEQTLVYNRFGSHNPYGMIYALKEDVRSKDGSPNLQAGNVVLRSDKRPRPLVLRVNEGDILEVRFTNLLNPAQPPGEAAANPEAQVLSQELRHLNNNPCAPTKPSEGLDAPTTRCAGIALSGLPTVTAGTPDQTGLRSIPPNQSVTYRWQAEHPGTFLFSSLAAPAGGQGDGGSLVHGLFGAVNVEPKNSLWYRSAVTQSDLALAKQQAKAPALIDYEAAYPNGKPVLNILQKIDAEHFKIVHSPLDAIIVEPGQQQATREFTVIFHDELQTRYQPDFAILSPEQFTQDLIDPAEKAKKVAYSKQLAGIRDGFGINYGASGMGTVLLANRLGKGPARDCVDCLYEEFFLQSWANGDPALLAEYTDDPSNVHHSYLNDPVKFQNSHAGPKETHVFHLHAHQWLSSDSGHANYLDSQTIGPQQGFSYLIQNGGSGNRNQTPGDSIFHCHLYPHFAQGMWELWRVHDVFEDGSRRLPDGGDGGLKLTDAGLKTPIVGGTGTDPLTGQTSDGTPIPALVPLPYQAMPPAPTYGENGFPGYPFYIAGAAGHRSPQPPLDIVENGGLGRHIVKQGKRHFPGGDDMLKQVSNSDLTAAIDWAQIQLIPDNGTPLEQAAMRFHAKADGYPSVTPEGQTRQFMVNGKPPQPGAPFADPCGKDNHDPAKAFQTRRYQVSAIDLDIQTNEHQWHDPQSRINVLDDEVEHYEHQRFVKDAEPFFFRAESGECVEFVHTNRTHKDLYRDDFQVATPTDIIGQHIHLVKFDVTASDGAGNGFNYQDGTMSKEAIAELAKASQAPGGSVQTADGRPGKIVSKGYQKTIQRWWVDPFFHENGYNAGLGTVFTHDHFAPSSIQHHGFYNALLVEPKGSRWLTPGGQDLKNQDKPCPALSIVGLTEAYQPDNCMLSAAVGSRAQILTDRTDTKRHPDTREFAMAIADYALLYDKRIEDSPAPLHMQHLQPAYQEIRQREGSPVDPPARPEAISTNHHNPYLINYKHEPIPLRIGKRDSNNHFQLRTEVLCGALGIGPENGGTICHPEDIAFAFNSSHPHGDPFLRPFRAYEGDKVQVRLIQGAQEVQHTFNVHGLSWKREANNPKAPYVNAQEIGISEHFELDTANIGNLTHNQSTADYLFHTGSQDALWNGGWGLIRAFSNKDTKDPTSCANTSGELPSEGPGSPACRKVSVPRASACSFIQDRQDGCQLRALTDNPDGKVNADRYVDANGKTGGASELISGQYCQTNNTDHFRIEAWQVKDLTGSGLSYDQGASVTDPDAVIYVQHDDVEKIKKGAVIRPLVLRAHAGHCIKVELVNRIKAMDDGKGDALMPQIVSFNVDDLQNGHAQAKPSNWVGLHPQLVNYDVVTNDGSSVGFNLPPTLNSGLGVYKELNTAGEFRAKNYHWYAGRVDYDEPGKQFKLAPFTEPVAAALTPADPIGQVNHGLFGALIIYPASAQFTADPDNSLSARVTYAADGTSKTYREHVVFYQDGLNLHQGDQAIPNCLVCDDSYDFGEKGVNYRSPAFWQRLSAQTDGKSGFNLNEAAFPQNFYEPDYKPLPFDDFTASPGEEVRFVVVHPGGRARQRSFQLYGHSFSAPIKNYGSPWAMLMAPGKAEILKYDAVKPGVWLFRDGPATIFANGSWGRLVVK